MTDIEAAAYLRELIEYNRHNLLITPQNDHLDVFWDCALEHGIRALEKKAGLTGQVTYQKNPNGSFTPIVPRPV